MSFVFLSVSPRLHCTLSISLFFLSCTFSFTLSMYFSFHVFIFYSFPLFAHSFTRTFISLKILSFLSLFSLLQFLFCFLCLSLLFFSLPVSTVSLSTFQSFSCFLCSSVSPSFHCAFSFLQLFLSIFYFYCRCHSVSPIFRLHPTVFVFQPYHFSTLSL